MEDNKNETSKKQDGADEERSRVSAGLDELSGRLRTAKGVDEDIATLLAANWQKLLGAVIVVCSIVWLVNEAKLARQGKAGDASQQFEKAQLTFGELYSPPPAAAEKPKADAKEEAQAKADQVRVLEDNLNLIEKNYKESIYGRLAPLYAASHALDAGNPQEASETLHKSFNLENPAQAGTAGFDGEQMANELAGLVYARVLSKEQKTDELVPYLEKLALNGELVNVQALIMLAGAASTPEQKKAAADTARALSAKRPDLTEQIRSELGKYGVSLDIQ